MPIGDINDGDTILPRSTGVLWGPPKVGKTTFLSSLPGKKLHIVFDPEGQASINYRKDFVWMDLSGYSDDEIVRYCTGDADGPSKLSQKVLNSEEVGEGDSLIVDSLSSYSQSSLITAIKNGVGTGRGFKPTIEAPGLSAYGARTQYTVNLVRNLLKVTAKKRMHCWFTSHEDTPTLNDEGKFLYQSMFLSDNGINQTGLAISEIWFMSDDGTNRKIAIRNTRGHKPMGSRMFSMSDEPEFILNYDPHASNGQPHSLETWFHQWVSGGKKPMPLPSPLPKVKKR